MQKSKEMALHGVVLAEVALDHALTMRQEAEAKAHTQVVAAVGKLARAQKRLELVQTWDQRRDDIATAVRNGATAAAIVKTYGVSRARAGQLLQRAQRDNK